MKTRLKIIVGAMLLALIIIGTAFAFDKANHYSVPAVVTGTDYDGYTLFETPDGNLWAYELPAHVAKGTKATLNMYDMSPDGKDVTDNVILSVEIEDEDGYVQNIDCRYDKANANVQRKN